MARTKQLPTRQRISKGLLLVSFLYQRFVFRRNPEQAS